MKRIIFFLAMSSIVASGESGFLGEGASKTVSKGPATMSSNSSSRPLAETARPAPVDEEEKQRLEQRYQSWLALSPEERSKAKAAVQERLHREEVEIGRRLESSGQAEKELKILGNEIRRTKNARTGVEIGGPTTSFALEAYPALKKIQSIKSRQPAKNPKTMIGSMVLGLGVEGGALIGAKVLESKVETNQARYDELKGELDAFRTKTEGLQTEVNRLKELAKKME